MASHAGLRNLSIGQYIPSGSVIHRLDPRAKLVACGLLIATTVAATGYVTNVLLLATLLALVRVARLPVGYILSAIKPAAPIILVLALMQLFFYGGEAGSRTLVAWGLIQVSDSGLRLVLTSLSRFVDLLLITGLLTNTTTTGELTRGIESVLRPLSVIGLPAHEVAMIGAIALRFLPILGEQMESVIMAQASRGVSAGGSGRWHVARNARRIASLIIPLFVDVYRRSDEMMLAMQARCYRGGKGRTHLTALSMRGSDYIMLTAVALLALAVALLSRTALP